MDWFRSEENCDKVLTALKGLCAETGLTDANDAALARLTGFSPGGVSTKLRQLQAAGRILKTVSGHGRQIRLLDPLPVQRPSKTQAP